MPNVPNTFSPKTKNNDLASKGKTTSWETVLTENYHQYFASSPTISSKSNKPQES